MIERAYLCDYVCVFVSAYSIFVCVFCPRVKMCTVCKGEKRGQYEEHVFTGSLSCECIMFPVTMPLPNKGVPVLSARA